MTFSQQRSGGIGELVATPLALDRAGVWATRDAKHFAYTDGAKSEAYVGRAVSATSDVSTSSADLESWIKDWPSQYHLSRMRTNLLNSFSFERSSSVLEVGCGCGAVTRFLGETFDAVTAVEGSIARARIARSRC